MLTYADVGIRYASADQILQVDLTSELGGYVYMCMYIQRLFVTLLLILKRLALRASWASICICYTYILRYTAADPAGRP
jgi:hypothetical protein